MGSCPRAAPWAIAFRPCRAGGVNADHERTVIERQIEATDREIDRLVYELYGLSEEEIRLVEGATG